MNPVFRDAIITYVSDNKKIALKSLSPLIAEWKGYMGGV